MHERLDIPWPCPAVPAFDELWRELVAFAAQRGLTLGRGTYGGWDDADPGLARAVWCLMTHLSPRTVVETGVARGVTSRVILEALERAGEGHLWSIDLPAMDPSLHREIGSAVTPELRKRWTYVDGTSRRRLPALLAHSGPIDLFVHDSSHTERNVKFELGHAWAAMKRGAMIADDIQQSGAFARFVSPLERDAWLVGQADDASALFGIVIKGL